MSSGNISYIPLSCDLSLKTLPEYTLDKSNTIKDKKAQEICKFENNSMNLKAEVILFVAEWIVWYLCQLH